MIDFKGKAVMITGAEGGIGSATSRLFVELGAEVINCDISYPKPSKVIQSIGSSNPHKVSLDVTDKSEVAHVIQEIFNTFGRLDVVVNGAGILRTKPFIEITEEEWDRMLDINLKGQFFVCQEALRHMITQKSGCFVNIASLSGKVGGIMAAADYSASKAGVICLTKSLAKTASPYGIRANSIAPGGIETKMLNVYREVWGNEHVEEVSHENLMGRWGTPEEVAYAIAFLASDKASFITGTCLDVNGGALLD